MSKKNPSVDELSQDERIDLGQRANARNIVQTILDYGVGQNEIVYIIKFFALELEDVHLMQKINELINSSERFATSQSVQQENGLAIQKKNKIYT